MRPAGSDHETTPKLGQYYAQSKAPSKGEAMAPRYPRLPGREAMEEEESDFINLKSLAKAQSSQPPMVRRRERAEAHLWLWAWLHAAI